MNPEALISGLEKDSFVPLRLNLTDGTSVDIHNPGLSFVNNLALYLARTDRPASRLVADMRIISLRHIVSIDQIDRGTSKPRKKTG